MVENVHTPHWTHQKREKSYLTFMRRRTYSSEITPHCRSDAYIQIFVYNYITLLLLFFLAHFLRSSICSTSLDSSTTLPFTIVCVTTFTIFRVLTSGSSANNQSRIDHFTWKSKYIIFLFWAPVCAHWNSENERMVTYFWEVEEFLSPCLETYNMCFYTNKVVIFLYQ